MCLAIYRSPNKKIPKEHLANGWLSNPHGAGFSYALNGQLVTAKGFFTYAEFLAAYETIPKQAPAIIHFRFATHGARNKFNCHPFVIRETNGVADMTLIHNGIIPNYGDIIYDGESYSDTAHFCRDTVLPLLNAIPRDLLNFGSINVPELDFEHLTPVQATTIAVIRSISAASHAAKLCVLAANGDHFIFGSKQGMWLKGVWYSNCYFQNNAGRQRRFCDWPTENDLIDTDPTVSDSDRENLQKWLATHKAAR